MKLPVIFAFALGLMTSSAHAVPLIIGDADLGGDTMFTGGNTKIKFGNDPGSAVFDLNTVAGQQVTIAVTGQNNDSDSFFNFFIDPDGSGALPEYQLGGNFGFRPGFVTLSLPSFTAAGADFLRITNGGTANNSSGQINAVSVGVAFNAAPVPGPLVGAGLPGLLFAFGGFIAWRRRRMAAP